METKHRNIPRNVSSNVEKSKTKISMNGVRDFSKKLTEEKKEILENSFEEIRRLTNDFENVKLQNEEMEIVLRDILKEKNQLEDSNQVLSKSYDALLEQYSETKKLLHNSHDQNVQLSEILEKMRENEKCLVNETLRLRKYGSLQDSNKKSDEGICTDTVLNLEKELKFWQKEAEKLSQIIELNDKTFLKTTSNNSLSKKKKTKLMKRYNKVVSRSHSVEASQRKSKEVEFEKLQTEKFQMKNLLNDLERQIVEIQNNVVKISEERQKYKDFYYSTKEKLDHNQSMNVNLERRVCDFSNENSKLSVTNNKLSNELDMVIKDNGNLKLSNENFLKEMSKNEMHHAHEIRTLELKLSSLVKENHDIGVRSNNLKSSINSLESDFKEMEEELQKKCAKAKEDSLTNAVLERELTDARSQLNDKSERLHSASKKLGELEESLHNIKKSEELLSVKCESKTKEMNDSRKKEKEKEETINNLKTSFSAYSVKLENRVQNADQIISSKIKLITSLELKVSNTDKELKSREEEAVHLKKSFNSKEHEFETLAHKHEEVCERKKFLENHLENLSANNEALNREVTTLNQVISEMKRSHHQLMNETKSLTENLNKKDDQIVLMDTQIERFEKELPVKSDELVRNKKIVSQLQNEIEQKECHIGSLLSILESKEEKILSIQACNEDNEHRVKEYASQLGSYDQSVMQSTARNSALEKEIEDLQNCNTRLVRQKEHFGQMLSDRNKTIGHLQAQLDEMKRGRPQDKIATIDDFFEAEDTNPKRERRGRNGDQRNCTDVARQHNLIPVRTRDYLSDNYDQNALRQRAQSHNGRSSYIINAA